MSSVFIGMPVYNGTSFISEAIESILHQDYTDWKLLISDNASEDTTQEICEKYIKIDSRIHYIRQIKNLGAPENFEFLLNQADAEFFMWASADDVWNKNFISACLTSLKKNPQIGLAFCNIVNIDSFGRTIREYPSFEIYSGSSSRDTIVRYLKSPEFFGKANLIYSLYRLKICKDAWKVCPLTNHWGSDMCFILGALTRGGICIDQQVLFKKRIERETDTPDHAEKILVRNPDTYSFDFLHSFTYINDNLKAVKGTPYYWIVLAVLLGRLPNSLTVFCLSPVYYIFRKLSSWEV
jgi:glycosyltransferase involved in cell wall biosynthesis